MDLLLMGVVAKAHGLRGEVVVAAFHDASPAWAPGTTFALIAPDRVPQGARDRIAAEPARTVTVRRARKAPDGRWTLALDGVADRDAADALRGFHLALDPASLPAPEADEVYHHELPGWDVVDVAGVRRGVVVGVFSGPGGDLLDVDVGDGARVYVPFVGAIVKEIDRSGRRLVIDPPEGLFDP